jgi:hypothetical protein
MKIYLAGSYNRRTAIASCRTDLETIGHQVTSRWLDCHDGKAPAVFTSTHLADIPPSEGRLFAEEDLADIDAAELVACFTQHPSTTGGRHVELGYALGTHKKIAIIGSIENIFQTISGVELYPTWMSFYLELQRGGQP